MLHLVLCLLPKAHRDTMEVLFRFLNWVSSFHTVDEETGNKMDTWNIATVMAPNILRESNDKEMRNVDQGAVKVVFDLIENNDEFSEVCVKHSFAETVLTILRCHRKSWNYSMTTLLQTCLRRRSCGSGNREARIHSRLQQRHRESKVARLRGRISATLRKSHPRTAISNPTQARHQFGT